MEVALPNNVKFKSILITDWNCNYQNEKSEKVLLMKQSIEAFQA